MTAPADPLPFDETFLSDPHAAYAALHRQGVVHRAVSPDGAGLPRLSTG